MAENTDINHDLLATLIEEHSVNMTSKIQGVLDVNIQEKVRLTSPVELHRELPLTEDLASIVYDNRLAVRNILSGEVRRVIAGVGPCSIHREDIAMEYVEKLSQVAADVSDRLLVVMRVYFEKPRTTVGWKGLINDPGLNDTFDMEKGVRMARRILLNVNKAGMPVATEMLEPITPQYIADLVLSLIHI